jgi:hypothetical protein
MRELNARIRHLEVPDRMKGLPISDQGFPLPWFVPFHDGKPEPHLSDPDKFRRAHQYRLCWCCGHPMTRHLAFVLGPMCAISRFSGDPACHKECAEYAVKACPFLANPRAKRNPNLPDEAFKNPDMNLRNSGIGMVWVTHTYDFIEGGFRIGQPVSVSFWREGQPANRAEVIEALDNALPLVRDDADRIGSHARNDVEANYRKAMELVPA